MASDSTTSSLRWRLESDAPESLFPTEALVERHVGRGEFRGLEFFHVRARTIVNRVPAASRMPFTHTINAYRGCSMSCSYCFARPTHAYLGLNTGTDWDSRIVVKVNAVERVRSEVASPKWSGAHIAMGTNTDPYQKAEGKYHLTRGIVGVLGEARNPFSILTKSTLVLLDLDVLTAAAARTEVRLNLSIGTLDRKVWRLTEPGTPPPDKRIEAVRRINDAGIPCGVLIAPILPGLSDSREQLRAVVDACVGAGAESVSAIPLHLRPGVREHYLAWLEVHRPDLLPLYEQRFTGRNGPRSYQPKAVAEALSAQVLGMVRDAERRGGGRRRAHVVDSGDGDRRRILAEQGIADAAPPPEVAPAPPQQLGLDL